MVLVKLLKNSWAYLSVAVALMLHLPVIGETIDANTLIQELLSGSSVNAPVIDLGIVNGPLQVDHDEWNSLFTSASEREQIELPLVYRNFASGLSSLAKPWRFKNKALNDYFINIFYHIRTHYGPAGCTSELNPNDLFHGHLFLTEDTLGILFHAKEYPNDLFPHRKPASDFTSDACGFENRNLLWLQKVDKVWSLDAAVPGRLQQLILPEWLDLNAQEPWMQDVYQQIVRAKTIREIHFNHLGRSLGDINFFLTHSDKNEQELLFFTLEPENNKLRE